MLFTMCLRKSTKAYWHQKVKVVVEHVQNAYKWNNNKNWHIYWQVQD